MHLRKWLSNSANILEKIPVKVSANEVDLSKSIFYTQTDYFLLIFAIWYLLLMIGSIYFVE